MMEALALSLSLTPPSPSVVPSRQSLFRPPPLFIPPPAEPRPNPPDEAPARKAPPPMRASHAGQATIPRPNPSPAVLPRPTTPPANQPPWNPYAHLPIWRPRITPTLLPRNAPPRPERFAYFPSSFAAYATRLPRASRITSVEEVITDSDEDDRSDVTSTVSTAPSHHYQYPGESPE